jgi:hypothetical protein
MTSLDNQVSEKRRRLFKALSAAPVVATLRPGEALANSSSFQCVQIVRERFFDPEKDLGPFFESHDPVNNLVLEDQRRRYWDASKGFGVGEATCAVQTIPDTGYIVKYGNRYFAQGANERGGRRNEVLNASLDGDDLVISNTENPPQICWRFPAPTAPDPIRAYWPKVFYTDNNDSHVFARNQSYPRRFLRADGTRAAGSNQVLNGSCLCSVNPDIGGGGFCSG